MLVTVIWEGAIVENGVIDTAFEHYHRAYIHDYFCDRVLRFIEKSSSSLFPMPRSLDNNIPVAFVIFTSHILGLNDGG